MWRLSGNKRRMRTLRTGRAESGLQESGFFETYDFSGVTIIPFNTHEGSRDSGTYKDIQKLEPNATVLDGLAVRGQDAGKDSAKMSVTEWLGSLGF